ncbi:MAG: uroporphyrinogen decarboxylase family protein, partial [bacterium]
MRAERFKRLFGDRGEAGYARGPMIAADHLAVLLNKPLGEICRSGELLAEGLLKAQRIYHSDFIIIFADVSVEAEALGVKLEYYPQRNPQIVEHVDLLQQKTENPVSYSRIPELFRAARLCRRELGQRFPIFFSMKDPFSLAAMAQGSEDFLVLLPLAADRVHEILEICCQRQMELMEAILLEGYVPFIGAPIASGGLIGRQHFRRFAMPYLKRLLDLATRQESFRCLHLCGEISMLTEELADLEL